MKAGRTKPKHKNGGSDSGAMQDWFALMTVVQVISVCQGRLRWPLAWQPASEPQEQTLSLKELQAKQEWCGKHM